MPALIDTGPLVAYFNRADRYHDWASARFAELSLPTLTCEAVLAETCFILAKYPGGQTTVPELLKRGAVEIGFDLQREIEPVSRLIARYANVPMSLADASLVRMSEIFADSTILTLDGDFRIYHRHGRQAIPLIAPDTE